MKFIISGRKRQQARLEILPEEILKLVNEKLQAGTLQADLAPDYVLPPLTGLQVLLKEPPVTVKQGGSKEQSGKRRQVLVFSGESETPLSGAKIINIDEPEIPDIE
jgi:hypothetical protein